MFRAERDEVVKLPDELGAMLALRVRPGRVKTLANELAAIVAPVD